MTSSASGVCGDCARPRRPGAIFCECGALLDYSTSGNGHANGTAVAVAEAEPPPPPSPPPSRDDAASNEWPPGPYQALHEGARPERQSLRVVHCPNDKCKALNPSRLLVCWRCGTAMIQGEQAKAAGVRRRRWWLFFRQERAPLQAGQREYPEEPFISRDPKVLLRAGVIVAGVLLLLSALIIGVVKAWDPATAKAAHGYGWTREKLFPRFSPHHPSSVWPPRVKRNPKTGRLDAVRHPASDAFDRNLSTYWQSVTPRAKWDNLRVNFKPAVDQFTDVSVFAGDPTATTIVPRALQLTFYRWEPHLTCNGDFPHFPVRVRGTFCVIGRPTIVQLQNTPTEQRFTLGLYQDVAQIVVTVRGTHRTNKPKAKAAITDIEFFDRH